MMALGMTWAKVLRKAWSVRLTALAVLFMAAEVAVPIFAPAFPPYVFVALSVSASIGSIWARVLVQTNMESANGKPHP